jgi:hypothetical protein
MRLQGQILLTVGGNEDRHRPWMGGCNRASCLDSSDTDHRDVHEDEIWLERSGERNGLFT